MAKASATRAKGEGSVFRDASGRWMGRVEIGYVGEKRRKKTVTGATRAEVVRRLKAVQREIDDGLVAEDVTVEKWMAHWLDVVCPERGLKPKTVYGYRGLVEQHIVPAIGRVQLRRLTPDHVRAVHRHVADAGLAPATVRKVHAVLSRALKVAEREGRIKRNPATLVDAPSPDRNPHPVLSVEQAKAVLGAAAGAGDARLLARLTVALVLGLRQGEALGLMWSDVDLDAGVLHVDEALSTVPGFGSKRQDTKTASSRRAVPLPAPVAAILRKWRDESGDGWVFPSRSGGPQYPKADWTDWSRALEAAEVPHVPLHGARGTAASLLLAMGVPERYIADILGHRDARITQAHYLHSDEAQRLDALDRLAGALQLGAAA